MNRSMQTHVSEQRFLVFETALKREWFTRQSEGTGFFLLRFAPEGFLLGSLVLELRMHAIIVVVSLSSFPKIFKCSSSFLVYFFGRLFGDSRNCEDLLQGSLRTLCKVVNESISYSQIRLQVWGLSCERCVNRFVIGIVFWIGGREDIGVHRFPFSVVVRSPHSSGSTTASRGSLPAATHSPRPCASREWCPAARLLEWSIGFFLSAVLFCVWCLIHTWHSNSILHFVRKCKIIWFFFGLCVDFFEFRLFCWIKRINLEKLMFNFSRSSFKKCRYLKIDAPHIIFQFT